MELNENIKYLPESSVSVSQRIHEFLQKNPSATLLRLDQNLMNMALPPMVVEGMKQAVEEVATPFGTRLNSPWSGYVSLKKAIAAVLHSFGAEPAESEIFITSGLESANSCLSALFSSENTVLLTDPCERSLPLLHQCSGRNISFVRATPENQFMPRPENASADLIYLASPCPVTGTVLSKECLQEWVDFANANQSILIYDSSLSEYLDEDPDQIHSIYQLEGAKDCAIELFSFERGFGVRELKVAYVIIPHTLRRNGAQINALFCARQSISATPPSFIMQRAAELILRREARMDVDKLLHRIKKVSRRLSQGLTEAGIPHTGGQNAPFLWAQCPRGMSAWAFFDFLLEKAHCVVTPGSNFGYGGERFFRLTAFGMPDEAEDAMLRFQVLLSSSQSVRTSTPSEEEVAKRLFSE